jgi:hypothetical protein
VDLLDFGVAAFTSATHQQQCILDLVVEGRHGHHLSGSEHPPTNHTGNEFGPDVEEHGLVTSLSNTGV